MSDKPRYWKPLVRVTDVLPHNQAAKDFLLKMYPGKTWQDVERIIEADERETTLWANDLYQVQLKLPKGEPRHFHINIRRVDGRADLRDWRHFQQIKNEIVGEEVEAIEIYPAESRKWDTSNKFHLWGILDPTYRIPVGWDNRDVSYESGPVAGMRQRSL